MQRNETERRREPRRNAERMAAQPLGGEPRPQQDGGEDASQDPSYVPNFLTASELQAWDPATSPDRRAAAGDRRQYRTPSQHLPRRVFKAPEE